MEVDREHLQEDREALGQTVHLAEIDREHLVQVAVILENRAILQTEAVAEVRFSAAWR
ncbi:hypothetical protein JCM19039_2806 [Geomicrobium sp. JCM 19039]|nr:hypothetical protein JCM19039_2806 [Geomicrobium sp. JCM 19039]